jgi:uncharacterized protein YecT (DUF1311 family)
MSPRLPIVLSTLIVLATLSITVCGAQAAGVKITTKTISETKSSHEIKIDYPQTGVARIDTELATWARKLASEFAAEARAASADGARGSQAWSSELSFTVARNDGAVLSLVFAHYTYAGGAHPNTTSRTFHFLMPDGQNAEIAELFTPRGIRRISDIAINRLQQDLGGPDGLSDDDWIKRGAGPNPKNFASFVLTPTTLTLHFDAYQVAAYAAGPQKVRIPLARLRDTLRADPRAPAASYDCAAARGVVETTICGSTALARLDRRMSEAYLERLAWAEDEAARAALRQSQRAWIAGRNATCPSDPAGPSACLTRLYHQRLEALAPDAGR